MQQSSFAKCSLCVWSGCLNKSCCDHYSSQNVFVNKKNALNGCPFLTLENRSPRFKLCLRSEVNLAVQCITTVFLYFIWIRKKGDFINWLILSPHFQINCVWMLF